jgi:hypothetical protein
MSNMRMHVSYPEPIGGDRTARVPTVPVMATTLLTRRRAVDHCRVRSSLCLMS